jgi:CDP-diacylglycerol--glycerol-3-phosphate 3-phosphatidyltransferase
VSDRATKRQLKQEERARRKALRRPSILREQFWNLPNGITLARIAVIPLFIWLAYDGNPIDSFWAAVVFTAASLSDVLDGYLARRWNQSTIVGKFLDPLADKLIVMSALVMMVRLGRLAAWVVIILLARELVIGGLRTIAATEGMVIAAGQEGKWKTSLQLCGVIALCLHYVHPLDLIWVRYTVNYNLVGQVLIYLSTILSIWSAAVYFRAFLQRIAQRERPQSAG